MAQTVRRWANELAQRIQRHQQPLWRVEVAEPSGLGLWLPGVRCVVFSAVGGNHQSYNGPGRRERTGRVLAACGWKHWDVAFSRVSMPYQYGLRSIYASVLGCYDPPLLTVEDDIEPREFRANVSPPPDAEICYLGGSRSHLSAGASAALSSGCQWRGKFGYAWKPYDATWFRVAGMLSTHAVLWLDRRRMRECAACWCWLGSHIDWDLAALQAGWRCYCLHVPMFFQNDGHSGPTTWDYAPWNSSPWRDTLQR